MKDLNLILKNQRGVALMMIMTSIIFLTAVYSEFTFDSKISRIKATNILDRSQAKLMADSGVQMAMARLRLYKEGVNKVKTMGDNAAMVPDQLLNQLWEVPFMYPIPVGAGANMTFKDNVEKFQTESFLEGSMRVSIQNISNRLNLNMLRLDLAKFDPSKTGDDAMGDPTSVINTNDSAILTDVSVDQSLYFLLKRLVDQKKESDEAFEDRYEALNFQELLTNLKFYVSDQQSLNQDPLAGDAENNFSRIPLSPKFGPLGSASELYAIPGWNDELIELIQNEFSVYPTTQIDFNKVTANMLKILFPKMTDDQVKEFFLYRDDPETPVTIDTTDDMLKFIKKEGIMSDTEFSERITMFQEKGITFGAKPNLFKIVSEGMYNRATFTLVAYVVLPIQEVPPPKYVEGMTEEQKTKIKTDHALSVKNAPLLDPRIIEIQIN
ncbi:MAG TPA: hypothetical protein VNJ01_07225 [Bacteriovoracaceae bacterium]|nr:hypothetical protein [Bacteriovoracaceae bacterium]